MKNGKEEMNQYGTPPFEEKSRFGKTLKEIREGLGMSQREFARHTNMHDSSISLAENGKRKPIRTLNFWEGLADVPGITQEAILELRRSAGIRPSLSFSGSTIYEGIHATLNGEVDIIRGVALTPDEKAEAELIIEAMFPIIVRDKIDDLRFQNKRRGTREKKMEEIRAALASEKGASGGDAR